MSDKKNNEIVFLVHDKEQDKNNKRRTIAAIVANGVMKFGVATCGPKDQFCRKIGRQISVSRAEKTPSLQFMVPDLDMKNLRELFKANLKIIV